MENDQPSYENIERRLSFRTGTYVSVLLTAGLIGVIQQEFISEHNSLSRTVPAAAMTAGIGAGLVAAASRKHHVRRAGLTLAYATLGFTAGVCADDVYSTIEEIDRPVQQQAETYRFR